MLVVFKIFFNLKITTTNDENKLVSLLVVTRLVLFEKKMFIRLKITEHRD